MDFSLDLGKVDPPLWQVIISGAVYGPYTLGQLQSFAEENRIRPKTRIAKGDGAPFVSAEDIPELVPALRAALRSSPRRREEDDTVARNFIMSFNLKSCGDEPLVRVLNSMGFFVEILPGTYLLRSQMPLKSVKERLSELLQTSDGVFIADATSNRFATINLPIENDLHVRDLWDKKSEEAA